MKATMQTASVTSQYATIVTSNALGGELLAGDWMLEHPTSYQQLILLLN